MKIVVTGNYGAQNLGDEMILKGLLEMLKTTHPLAEITVLSGRPSDTEKVYQVHSVEKFPAGFRSILKNVFYGKSAAFKAVKECDYFILGGGGLFGGPKRRANFIWGIQVLMAYWYDKKVIMCGQSIGPLNSFIDRFIVKKIFQKAKLIILRDEKSKERLEQMGVKNKTHVYPDIAFNSKTNEAYSQKENRLIVALRQIKEIPNDFLNQISEFLNWLINEHKWHITFVNFQKGIESDESLSEEVIKLISNKSHLELINNHNLEEITQRYLQSNMVLGMRLHSLVLAIKTNTPFIAINYAPKVKDLLDFSGFHDATIDLSALTSSKLKEQFSKLTSLKPEIVLMLQSYNEQVKKEHSEMKELLANTIR